LNVASLLFPLLAFLFPLTIYLFVVGLINRRRSPLVVSGSSDFVGVLFAASGFLMVGGPCILQALEERMRVEGAVAGLSPAGRFGLDEATFWNVVWAVYIGVLILGSLLLFWWRGRTTSVYNVEAPVLEEALVRALDSLGLAWNRWGNGFSIRPAVIDADVVLVTRSAATPPFQIDLNPFPLMWHATLLWSGAPAGLRRQIEIELEKQLSQTETRDSPVSSWLFALSAFLFFLMFGILLLLLAVTVLTRGA